MKVLFIHPNFPAQYRNIAAALARDRNNEIIYLTNNPRPEYEIPGVKKVVYGPVTEASEKIHFQARNFEKSTLTAEAALITMLKLKREQRFVPDIICGHSGWGATMFAKDVFPETPLLSYLEWYYHASGSNLDFDPEMPVTLKVATNIRLRNAPILMDLAACHAGITPTLWQKKQFPGEFHPKITQLHDGIDTGYFKPDPNVTLELPGVNLTGAKKLITYAARGMEPYRGFPQFIEALPEVLSQDKECHVIIAGEDRVCYSAPLPEGKSYKEHMLEKVDLDLSRVHFVGGLPYGQYIKLLQASDVHVYLTYPFVLSWSFLEAMSCGCLVVASNTEPVQEIIQDGENGIMVDFFSPSEIAGKMLDALSKNSQHEAIRQNARNTIMEKYSLQKLLPLHIKLIKDIATHKN